MKTKALPTGEKNGTIMENKSGVIAQKCVRTSTQFGRVPEKKEIRHENLIFEGVGGWGLN